MFANRKTLITLVFLTFTAAFAAAPMAADDSSSRATPMKFVGTFYGDNSRIITYNSDGTASLVLADMFTEDLLTPSAGRKTTPMLGVWRKVDNNKIQVTTLSFATEQSGHNYNANGFIFKTKWLAIFDEPVKGVSPGYTAVNIVVEGFLPFQNPITDVPAFVVPQPDGRADRLKAE
jgi:hypothetical protein